MRRPNFEKIDDGKGLVLYALECVKEKFHKRSTKLDVKELRRALECFFKLREGRIRTVALGGMNITNFDLAMIQSDQIGLNYALSGHIQIFSFIKLNLVNSKKFWATSLQF